MGKLRRDVVTPWPLLIRRRRYVEERRFSAALAKCGHGLQPLWARREVRSVLLQSTFLPSVFD